MSLQTDQRSGHGETYFPSHHELARLPYFERQESGRLRLADRSIGPAIDVHTHLALA